MVVGFLFLSVSLIVDNNLHISHLDLVAIFALIDFTGCPAMLKRIIQ